VTEAARAAGSPTLSPRPENEPAESLPSRFAKAAARLLGTWWVSYLFIAALQLKVIWDIWRFRDLTAGDTSSYFTLAVAWAEHLKDNILWSPLYTIFYGTLYAITGDAYDATIAHRVIIVMLAALGVLAVMRSLLPPALALLIATWWAVLPINFDTLYEVHLFALLPTLAAWLVAAKWDTPAGRGIVLAILATTTVLVRNELSVATAIFGAICLFREVALLRRGEGGSGRRIGILLRAYLVPLCIGAIVCGVALERTRLPRSVLADMAHNKHAVNMCQVYAFGYGQRHPDWKLSPWTECGVLAKPTFGAEHPTLGEMIRNNPHATAEHFLWNLGLTPAGLQLALFNGTFGSSNPDYVPVAHSGSWLVGILSVAVLVLVAIGAWQLWRHRRYWWKAWFRQRQGIWYAMLSVAVVAGPVILIQRPRPSYLFALTCTLMAIVGCAAMVLTWKQRRWLPSIAVAIWALVFVSIPPYYIAHPSSRPILADYRALKPAAAAVRAIADRSGATILGANASDVGNYMGSRGTYLDYSILARRSAGQSLSSFLDQEKIDGLLVQPDIYGTIAALIPGGAAFLADPAAFGWQKVAGSGDPRWALYTRTKG